MGNSNAMEKAADVLIVPAKTKGGAGTNHSQRQNRQLNAGGWGRPELGSGPNLGAQTGYLAASSVSIEVFLVCWSGSAQNSAPGHFGSRISSPNGCRRRS